MIRSVGSIWALAALVVVAATVASCNNPQCGKGTKQVQGANGDITCEFADSTASNITCDTGDGGTSQIVNGVCVSRVMCDPGSTKLDPATGQCVSTGVGNGCSCATPGAGKICVTGDIRDYVTGMKLGNNSRQLHVGLWEPLGFLANPTGAQPLADTVTTNGCFSFTVNQQASGLIAVGVNDPSTGPGTNPPLIFGGSGATTAAGSTYQVDGYMVVKSVLDGYAAVNPAFGANGAFTACYYKDKPPRATDLTMFETMPATGVKLLENSVTPAAVKYLKPDKTVDPALTATGAIGCAITPGTGGINNYSGTGGGIAKWETTPGASAVGLVFVGRFHNCDIADPGTASCQ